MASEKLKKYKRDWARKKRQKMSDAEKKHDATMDELQAVLDWMKGV